jgi:Flp pilus assembly protein TadD
MSTSEELTKAWTRAENAFTQRRYDTAAALWEVYLALDPGNVNARVNRVVSLLNSGQAEEALGEARLAHGQQPDSEATAMALLESLDNNGLTEELKSKSKEFTEVFPRLPSPWSHLGKLLFLDGEYEEAVRFARKAVELRSTFCFAWLLVGECCMRLSRYEEALTAFGQGLGTFQDYPSPQQAKFDSLVGMGRALAFLNKPGRALILADQAEAMNVNAAEAQGLKARCKFRLGHPDAISVAENALRLGYRDDFLEVKLAGAYVELGRDSEAKRIMEKVHPNPDDKGTRHTRAGVLMRMGNIETAIAELEALKGKFGSHIILNSLSTAYRLHGDLERAENLALEAVAEKRDAVTVGNLAFLYSQTGQFKKAEPLFKEALELQPNNPGFLAPLGYCYSRQGKKTMARDVLLKASESEYASQHIRSLADELLGQLNNQQELEKRYKDEGKSPFAISEVEGYRQLERDYRTAKFEVESCRIASETLGWSRVEQRKKITKAGKVKTPDVYGFRKVGDEEVVCLGECKMKNTQLVTHSEVAKLVQRMDLVDDIEADSEKRGVEGYFFTTTDYDEDAKEIAREHGITMYRARISGNPQKSSEWRISKLEEVD